MNLPASTCRKYISGGLALSITVKSDLASALQPFSDGGGLGDRGLTWTGSRSSFLRQMVKPFFRGSREKWLLGIERAKMVTTGGPPMHLQKASKLSRQWGPLQPIIEDRQFLEHTGLDGTVAHPDSKTAPIPQRRRR